MKFFPKPVVIEAWHTPKSEITGEEKVPDWVADAVNERRIVCFADGSIGVEQMDLKSQMARPGDYIILSVDSKLSVMTEKLFKMLYTRATKRMLEVA